MTHRYAWKKNRKPLYGMLCLIVATGSMGSVLVEFENGHLEVISRRAIRRIE